MTLPDAYERLILNIGLATGLQDAALHMNAGLAILLLTRLATGRRLSTMVPLAAVILAETINEIIDRMAAGSWRWPDTSSDVFYTLLWPSVISLARWAQTYPWQAASTASVLPPLPLGPEKGWQAARSVLAAVVRPTPVIALVSVTMIILSLAVMNNLFGITERLDPAAALHRASAHPAPVKPARAPLPLDKKILPARNPKSGPTGDKAHKSPAKPAAAKHQPMG